MSRSAADQEAGLQGRRQHSQSNLQHRLICNLDWLVTMQNACSCVISSLSSSIKALHYIQLCNTARLRLPDISDSDPESLASACEGAFCLHSGSRVGQQDCLGRGL